MNYFSSTFLVSLLLLWLGGSHIIKQLQPYEAISPGRNLQKTEQGVVN